MSFEFRWNIYADQPHNVALRKERLRHHLKYAGSYFGLLASNIHRAVPVLSLYRQYRKKMFREQVRIDGPFALSISPAKERSEEVLECLKETGIRKSLVRIPSWEVDKLDVFEKFFSLLSENGIELTIALLQNRDDVLNPARWQHFLEDVFSRFGRNVSFFEIGHAWNRTKWGVWDYREYLKLARPAVSLAEKYGVKLVGPAVIDFEFHLYPAVLNAVPFEKVSSLLYVDRVGAPENKQFGWDASRKLALLKAVIDGSSRLERDLWITEVNWPLKGTGKYSPASGKPNVSEEEQANYLVRYYILCLASGFVERIYWWQLVAPGYGLIDNRKKEWRKRPGFYALKFMVTLIEESTFTGKVAHPQAMIFSFRRNTEDFSVCWTGSGECDYSFSRRIIRVLNRDGEEIPFHDTHIKIDQSPKYVFLA
ncbi:MAG: hypothetical protein KAU46_11755 [Candidatus Aminicenantes bacterium]|nr:hypothetical protein [Candidatus Aminicenantes bacterium]